MITKSAHSNSKFVSNTVGKTKKKMKHIAWKAIKNRNKIARIRNRIHNAAELTIDI